jgi:inorganic pyrophosphatase
MPLLVVALILALQAAIVPPATLPPSASAKLRESLNAAKVHAQHLWRDTPPLDLSRRSSPEGSGAEAEGALLNGYIEIPLGGRQKFELDMAKNAPVLDRLIPEKIGGYPVNYGIVPQTVSYDGDPFDVLVLGPAIPTGQLVKGVIVGLMHMHDETGLDSKVVISRVGSDGKPLHQLTDADRQRMADYFNRYKRDDDDPKTFATVPGWGTAAEGLAFVRMTHEFFLQALKNK